MPEIPTVAVPQEVNRSTKSNRSQTELYQGGFGVNLIFIELNLIAMMLCDGESLPVSSLTFSF